MEIEFSDREMTAQEVYLHDRAHLDVENMLRFVVMRAAGVADADALARELFILPMSQLFHLFRRAAIPALATTRRACAEVEARMAGDAPPDELDWDLKEGEG